jgi:serine protease Do
VGFAIPSKHVGRVVNDLIEFGFVRYAVLGVELAGPQFSLAVPRDRQLIAEMTESSEPPSYGVLVARCDASLPAHKAGIRDFDVILEIDGKRMESNIDFVRATMEKDPGDEVEIKLWSRGRTKTVNVELASRSE